MSILIGLVCLAVAAITLIGWLAGTKGAASFLTVLWLMAIIATGLYLPLVPVGHDPGVWLGFLATGCVSFVAIWLPFKLRSKPASFWP